MSRLAFRFTDKVGKGLESWVLHKAPKGRPRCDVIKLCFLKVGDFERGIVMTPGEACVIAAALLQAVVLHNNRRWGVR